MCCPLIWSSCTCDLFRVATASLFFLFGATQPPPFASVQCFTVDCQVFSMVKDNYDSGRNRLGADENSGNNMQAFDPAEGLMPMSTQGNQVARSL